MKITDWIRRWLPTRTALKARGEEAPALSEDDDSDVDPFDPFPGTVEIEIGDVIDLHAMPARDTRAVVEEYLYQAHLAGFRQVRIIHGKGTGVQRQIVRSILARTPFVEHYADAPVDAGGWGATIARLTQS